MSGTTLTTPGAVIAILAGEGDWREALERAGRLAAASGKPLRVLATDGDDLVTAAALDCVSLVAPGGLVGAFDPADARRQLRARRSRLRRELDALAARLGITAELVEAQPGTVWAGCAALTVFGRRRLGSLLVVHAGTAETLDVAARLAADLRQEVRLLLAASAPAGEALGRFGHLLRQPPLPLESGRPLGRPPGLGRIAAVVLDPAYVAARQLTLDALLGELRTVMGRVAEGPAQADASEPQAPSPT